MAALDRGGEVRMAGGLRSCARAPVRVDPAGGGTDAPRSRWSTGGWW